MKKLLPLLLTLLLLAGCGLDPAGTTGPDTTADMADNTTGLPAGLYDPNSDVEAVTGGAVRAYPLEQDHYYGLAAMGTRLLLLADDGSLTALQDEQCQVSAVMNTGTMVYSDSVSFDTNVQGVAYYLEDERQVVLLNPQLQQINRIQLPQDIQGLPAVSLEKEEIYYGIPGQLRALNIQTGISRLVRSHSYTSLTLTGLHFDGTLLSCRDESGQALYMSTQTGQTVTDRQGVSALETQGKNYFAMYLDGMVFRNIYGQQDQPARCLNVQGPLRPVLALGGVVSAEQTLQGLQLQFYHLDSGKRTAAVSLPGVGSPVAYQVTERYLWILSYQGEHQVLYRWDLDKSPVEADTDHSGPLFTAENPDTEGLAACQSRADSLSSQYGVTLQIWQDALQNPQDYTLTAEYQPDAIQATLDSLEQALARFPQGFLEQTVEAGQIRVCLVRSTGTEDALIQYWANGDCYVVLACGPRAGDMVIQGVAYGIDSHVLGNSRDFDEWDTLNPKGFAYDFNYQLTAIRTDAAQYLESEDRAFCDLMSMSFPHEDRSRLFAAAMAPENGELFRSERLQRKLSQICLGIREAYGLENSPEVYPWEQYLQTANA